MGVVTLSKAWERWEVKDTALVLAMSVILPFLIHLVPSFGAVPTGARFLPMFYAPFIAVILFRPHVAIITALLAPGLNSLLFGLPVQENVFLLTLELLIFSVIVYFIQRKWRCFPGAALLAYLAATFAVTCLLHRLDSFLVTVIDALPGLATLTLINIFLLRSQHK